jgi:hypothetical protein
VLGTATSSVLLPLLAVVLIELPAGAWIDQWPARPVMIIADLVGTESAMQTVEPGIGGLIAQAIGAALGLVFDAASFVISAICMWRLRIPAEQSAPTPEPTASLFTRIVDGIQYLRADRYLRWL